MFFRFSVKLVIVVLVCSFNALSQKTVVSGKNGNTKNKYGRKLLETRKAKVFFRDGQLMTAKITEKRDLAKYVDGGHFDCRTWKPAEVPGNCDIAKLREFLSENWNSKRRAYVRLSGDSVDAVSTSHIFIEPNKYSTWIINWRIVRHHNEINDLPEIVGINTRTAKYQGDCVGDCEKGSTVYVFIEWNGDDGPTI